MLSIKIFLTVAVTLIGCFLTVIIVAKVDRKIPEWLEELLLFAFLILPTSLAALSISLIWTHL